LKEKERKKSGECREQPCLIFSLFFKNKFGEISPKSQIKKLIIRKLGDFGVFQSPKLGIIIIVIIISAIFLQLVFSCSGKL
jgi:hypothetical protein